MNRISKHWQDFFLRILDFVEMSNSETEELELAELAKEQFFNDQFVVTSNLESIKRREKILGIQADPTTESLDFRKKRIVNRYSTNPPFSIRYLQERLDFLVGEGKTVASIDVQNFILTVEAAIEDGSLFKEVERTIYTTKPANIVYKQETALGSTIAIKEHIIMNRLERKTRLGTTWRLGNTPFAELKDEVVIK